MKIITIILIVALSLFVVSCTAPPSDVPAAVVVEDDVVGETETTGDIVQDDEEAEPQSNGVEGEVGEDASVGVEASAAETLSIDKETSMFLFEGYGPGKVHEGTFDVWEGTLIYENGVLVAGTGVIQTQSVDTGIGGLNKHLKTDDFFDVETYPEITAEFLSIKDTQATMELTFRGVTKTISFPVEVTDQSIKTDFLLDITDFNIKYIGIDDQVRIAFEFNPVQ